MRTNFLSYFVITIVVTQVFAGALYAHGQFRIVLHNLELASQEEYVTAEQLMKKLEQAGNGLKILLFAGDIMLSRDVGKNIKIADDPQYPFLEIADMTRAADLAFANLESPISSRGKNQGSQYSFRADPKVVAGLTHAGFDVLSLANNHIWDWGVDAFLDTVSILKNNKIAPVGAGANYAEANNPKIITMGRHSVAFLAYTPLYPRSLEATKSGPGVSHFELESMKKAVAAAQEQADSVIVSLHWGEEYETHSNAEQQQIARALIDAGTDLIIGHHPHVAQEHEQYKGKWIFYSLGNFVFDQTFSKETMEGLMARVVLQNGRIVKAEPIKIKISPQYQPYIE